MKRSLITSLTFLSLAFFSHMQTSEAQSIFSAEEESKIKNMAIDFSKAMGSATIDPGANCPGLREKLRAELLASQDLIEVAASLPTDMYSDSELARHILDAEEALQFVEKTCTSYGV